MRASRLAGLEVRRFGRGRMPRAALVALLLLPLLYGALYLWSFWDPYSRLDRVPVALVNDDRGAVVGGRRIAAGDEIGKGLRDSRTFDWREVDAEEAAEGLEQGRYYLSLTMPADFSTRIASSSGDTPETGALRVRTNDSNNYVVGSISKAVFSEVRAAASRNASRSFLDRIFISFSDLHGRTEEAADGADRLSDGIGKAKEGSKSLADGLTTAKAKTGELTVGLRKLDAAAGRLETGSDRVADGTGTLADRVNGLARKARPVLRDDARQIADTAELVADTAKAVRHHLGTFTKAAPGAERAAKAAAAELDDVYGDLCTGAAEPSAACPRLKKARDAASEAAELATDVNTLVKGSGGDLARLDRQLKTLENQARELARKAPGLAGELDAAVTRVNALNAGARTVADGMARLHTGLTSATGGSARIDSGVGRLGDGAHRLDGGIYKLVDGSGDLAGGLREGAERIPDYDEQQRDRRTEVMADPVRLAAESLHQAPNYGTGFAPYFIPLSLWVGAMVAYMLIQPLNRRALAAGASAWRIALAGWLPVAAIGTLQVAALMSVLHWGLGLEMAAPALTLGFLVLVTGCFAAIVQWLNAKFGAAGRILVLVVLMLQLTSAGGTYPVQTSPGFFNALHPWLPMSYVVESLRRLITGGDLTPVVTGSAVLLAFTAGALALTALAARGKQVWTMDRLHPELTL
ncbi:YhgE/Pip domain-containing protein [Streptomyces bambusae]|uniref:YhgE/Pip family protein n=1 Tax=Streptomyces bambusae TaxID=1550616 RepID=UPI001CFED12B|nr:YhgE/Pip domain-containing protein [Streptomyces bambusae]MCB5167214.1 YhgE/Pip domain-containing protein [Streptomyces bambusae]